MLWRGGCFLGDVSRLSTGGKRGELGDCRFLCAGADKNVIISFMTCLFSNLPPAPPRPRPLLLDEFIQQESEAEAAWARVPMPPLDVKGYERECLWCGERFRLGMIKSKTEGPVCCCPAHQKEWAKHCRWWKARGLNPQGMKMTRLSDGRVMTVKQAEIESRGRALEDEPKWMQTRGQNASCLKCGDGLGGPSWEYRKPSLFCQSCIDASGWKSTAQILWGMRACRWFPPWARNMRKTGLLNARESRQEHFQKHGTAPPRHVYL